MNKLSKKRIVRPLLHLDANTSITALHMSLIARGHHVSRTRADLSRCADDETQLMGAMAQGRCIFTFNVRDYLMLAERHPQHQGIILAVQSSWRLSELIEALHRLLSETELAQWVGQVRWLNEWRK